MLDGIRRNVRVRGQSGGLPAKHSLFLGALLFLFDYLLDGVLIWARLR
jgi:hypothetical protein